MGKRKKASKPQGPKKREPLATTFACLFCNHERSVSCKLDKKALVGTLACKVCGQTFQTDINALSAAVDIYSDWIDACDAVTKISGGGGIDGDDYGGEIHQRKDVAESAGGGGGGGGRRVVAEEEEELDEEDI